LRPKSLCKLCIEMLPVSFLTWLGTGHYLCRGVALKRNVFLGKNVADPTIKKSKSFLPNLKCQWEDKYIPLAKNVTKDTIQFVLLYHFCDMSLITARAIFLTGPLDPRKDAGNCFRPTFSYIGKSEQQRDLQSPLHDNTKYQVWPKPRSLIRNCFISHWSSISGKMKITLRVY
jgi:hypothetical protein